MGTVPARCLHMQSAEHAALPPAAAPAHTALHRAHCPHGPAGTASSASTAPSTAPSAALSAPAAPASGHAARTASCCNHCARADDAGGPTSSCRGGSVCARCALAQPALLCTGLCTVCVSAGHRWPLLPGHFPHRELAAATVCGEGAHCPPDPAPYPWQIDTPPSVPAPGYTHGALCPYGGCPPCTSDSPSTHALCSPALCPWHCHIALSPCPKFPRHRWLPSPNPACAPGGVILPGGAAPPAQEGIPGAGIEVGVSSTPGCRDAPTPGPSSSSAWRAPANGQGRGVGEPGASRKGELWGWDWVEGAWGGPRGGGRGRVCPRRCRRRRGGGPGHPHPAAHRHRAAPGPLGRAGR